MTAHHLTPLILPWPIRRRESIVSNPIIDRSSILSSAKEIKRQLDEICSSKKFESATMLLFIEREGAKKDE